MTKTLKPILRGLMMLGAVFSMAGVAGAQAVFVPSVPADIGLKSTYSASAYGAKGDGTTDDTAALNAAATAASAAGGVVYLPAGTYKVSHLTVAAKHVTLRGAGTGTVIASSAATGDTLTVTGDNCIVENIAFNPSVTKTSGYEITTGYTASGVYQNNVTVRDVLFGGYTTDGTGIGIVNSTPAPSGVYGCLHVNNTSRGQFDNIVAYGYRLALQVENGIDCNFNKWNSDSHNPSAQGVIYNAGESCNFNQCDWVDSYTGGSSAVNLTVNGGHFNTFTACYFDTCATALVQTGGGSFTFQGCWFPATTNAGISIQGGSGTRITGSMIDATGADGIDILAGDKHVLSGNEFLANGGRSPGFGIKVGSGCTGVRILGNHAGGGYADRPGITPASGQYFGGLQISSGATHVVATGNDFSQAAGIDNEEAGEPTNVITNNIGQTVARVGGTGWEDNFDDFPGTNLLSHNPTRNYSSLPYSTRSYSAYGSGTGVGVVSSQGRFYSAGSSYFNYVGNLDLPLVPVKVVQAEFYIISDIASDIDITWHGSPTANTNYNLRYSSNGTGTKAILLYRNNNNAPTLLANAGVTFAPGHVYTVRCLPTEGASDTFVATVSDNGGAFTPLFTVTDTSPIAPTAGANRVGFAGGGGSTDTTGFHLDNVSVSY